MTNITPETDRERYIRYRNDEVRKYEHAVEVVQNLTEQRSEKQHKVNMLNKEIDDLTSRLEDAHSAMDTAENQLTELIKRRRHFN